MRKLVLKLILLLIYAELFSQENLIVNPTFEFKDFQYSFRTYRDSDFENFMFGWVRPEYTRKFVGLADSEFHPESEFENNLVFGSTYLIVGALFVVNKTESNLCGYAGTKLKKTVFPGDTIIIDYYEKKSEAANAEYTGVEFYFSNQFIKVVVTAP